MFCPNCGSQLSDGAQFCGSCGYQLGGQSAPQPEAQPQYQQQPQYQPYQQPQYQQYQQPQPQYQQYQQPQYQQYQQPMYHQPAKSVASNPAKLIIGLLGAVLIIGSVFLPYLSAYGMDINMWDAEPAFLIEGFADTWFFLGLAVLGGVFSIFSVGIVQLLAGLGSLGVWVYELIQFLDNDAMEMASIGFYGLAVGSLVLLIGGIVALAKK